jgi:nitrogen fixation/metabolism regulation signal transduction histidine kinase
MSTTILAVDDDRAFRGVLRGLLTEFSKEPHGTGIGLPVAKKFVERNGGALGYLRRI